MLAKSYARQFVAQAPNWRAAILAALPALAVKMAGLTAYRVGDLAELVGINPADALDKTRAVAVYWTHKGEMFRDWAYLQTQVAMQWRLDIRGDVQIVVLSGVEKELAVALMGEVA